MTAHDDLHAYADGELDPARVAAFETHLVDCAECREGFGALLQLAALGEEAAAGSRVRVLRPGFLRRPAPVMALAASLLLTVATGGYLWRAQAAGSDALWLRGARVRLLEARVSQPEADLYRPYDVPRAGNATVAPPPLTDLGALERRGNPRGIAVAYLIRRQPEQAAPYLQAAGTAPEDDVDRAAAALLKNDPLEALEKTDRALRAAPGNPQARWNHALSLRDLGLLLGAAAELDRVAQLHEPGWGDEAARSRDALRAEMAERQASWDALGEACRRLIADGVPVPTEQVRRTRGWARACFYDGVRAAPSRERALALLPMAGVLDELYGDATATGLVRKVAARDFSRRAELAKTYAALATGQLPAPEIGPFLARLRASGEADLLLGALLFAPDLPQHLDEYRALAAATGDPWFHLLAEEKSGYAEATLDRLTTAEQRLRQALEACGPGSRQNYRCAWLERSLAVTYMYAHQASLAKEHALKALARANEGGEWLLEQRTLIDLGGIARLDGDLPLIRAYLEEALARSTSKQPCSVEAELIQTNLALAFQANLDFAEARRHLDQAAAVCPPSSWLRAFAVADISRVLPRDSDERVIRESLAALRASGTAGPGRLALATELEGRFQIERDRAAGQRLLREAVEAAARQPETDVDAQKARAYSYTSLILDAGKHGELSRALDLFAQELGVGSPPSCVLGVTVDDERTLALARGPNGELRGHYDASRVTPLAGAAGLVPGDLVDLLRGCPAVEVIARAPLAGQAELLPPDLAWSYRVSSGAPGATSTAPPHRLIVAGAIPPPSLRLPPLGAAIPAGDDPAATVLRGEAATPSRVLEAMRSATEVELHAHGLLNPERSDASFIALSPDADGRFALSAADLKQARLPGRPVVLLAACYAATNANHLHENFGLPGAFIHAGARAVLAATQEIPDAEAAEFFEAVLAAIRSGAPAPSALRDARVQWEARGRGRWVEQVLLFD